MATSKNSELARKLTNRALTTLELEVAVLKDLATTYDLANGFVKTPHWSKNAATIRNVLKPLEKLHLDKVPGIVTGLTTAFDEYHDQSAVRSAIKGVLTGGAAITVGVLLSGVSLPAIALLGIGAGLTYVATKAVGTIYDAFMDFFRLGFDNKLDFKKEGLNGLYTGTDNTDLVLGSEKADQISGGGKADRLEGRGGNDKLDGQDSKDKLFGGNGHDTLIGGKGSDLLKGGGGNDILLGGTSDGLDRTADQLKGEAGNDYLDGGGGKSQSDGDKLWGGSGQDVIIIRPGTKLADGGEGLDTLVSAVKSLDLGDLRHFGFEKYVLMEKGNGAPGVVLKGTNRAEKMFGNSLDNELHGRGGNDTLRGGAGKDKLFGNAGQDTLFAQSGGDRLFGGAHDDTFIFETRFAAKANGGEGFGNDMFIVKKGHSHVIDGGKGYDTVDLRGLNLSKVDFTRLKNIEEIWVDDIALTNTRWNFDKVRVFGTPSTTISHAQDATVTKFLFGGAPIETVKPDAITIRFQAAYDLKELKDAWDEAPGREVSDSSSGSSSLVWAYHHELPDHHKIPKYPSTSVVVQTEEYLSAYVERHNDSQEPTVLFEGEWYNFQRMSTASTNHGSADNGLSKVLFSWNALSSSTVSGDITQASAIPYDLPDGPWPNFTRASGPLNLIHSDDIKIGSVTPFYPVTFDASGTPGELIAVFG